MFLFYHRDIRQKILFKECGKNKLKCQVNFKENDVNWILRMSKNVVKILF